MFQPEAIDPAVSVLAELAGSRRALELAIGTGRTARLPSGSTFLPAPSAGISATRSES
jgi:hypothetical protein